MVGGSREEMNAGGGKWRSQLQVSEEYHGGSDVGRSQGGDECRWRSQLQVAQEYQGGSDGGRNEGGGDGRML